MYDMGQTNRNGSTERDGGAAQEGIPAAAAQRWVEADGGALEYTGGASHELTGNAIGDEFYDFYRTPRGEFTPEGQSAQPTTHPTLTSNVKFLNFYLLNDSDTISPRPLLFHHRRPGALEGVKRERLCSRGRTEGTGLGEGRGTCRSL